MWCKRWGDEMTWGGAPLCLALPRAHLCPQRVSGNPPQHRSQPTADTALPSDAWFNAFSSLTLLRPWAAVFKTKIGRGYSAGPPSFQKALEDQADDKNKNKSKPADKSVTQSFDSSQEGAVQSADCKVIDRGVHFTHFHSNLAIPVPQCRDRSLIRGGMKNEQKERK